MSDFPKFEDLLGKTLVAVTISDDKERARFITSDGDVFVQYHSQDCCETVQIEEVVGDLADVIGAPLLLAEEVTSENLTPEGVKPPEYPDSYTWTFYKLSTIKGSVTIRWLGESNGYYSEGVYFAREAA